MLFVRAFSMGLPGLVILGLTSACNGDAIDPKSTTAGSGGGGGAGAGGGATVVCIATFESDQNGGCVPILPATPCPPGQLAVPGDMACHPVAACGDGDYGNITTDTDSQHVDALYMGGASDGSAAAPWTSIQAAVDAADANALIAVAAGTYVESVRIATPVTIWGRCPDLVEVQGSLMGFYALEIVPGGEGSTIRNLALSGQTNGVRVATTGVLLDALHIHGFVGTSIDVFGTDTPASVVLRSSLLENTIGISMFVVDATATIEESVLRAGAPGIGVVVSGDTRSADLTLRGSIVEDYVAHGIVGTDASVAIEGSVIRAIAAAEDGRFGDALAVVSSAAANGVARVSDTLIGTSARAGIANFGASVEIRATRLACNTIDLNGEKGEGEPGADFMFADLGANSCGCDDQVTTCKILSTDLEPPEL